MLRSRLIVLQILTVCLNQPHKGQPGLSTNRPSVFQLEIRSYQAGRDNDFLQQEREGCGALADTDAAATA